MTTTAGSASSTRLRIFLVEDHEDTRVTFKAYLESRGHFVATAASVKEAVEALPTAHCDVLFSDIGLPDGTGWDLLRDVRLEKPIYAVAMSGFGMQADRARSYEAGFRHHLVKPPRIDKILTILDEVAAERGL